MVFFSNILFQSVTAIALPLITNIVTGPKLSTETYLEKLPTKIKTGTFNLAKDTFTDLVKNYQSEKSFTDIFNEVYDKTKEKIQNNIGYEKNQIIDNICGYLNKDLIQQISSVEKQTVEYNKSLVAVLDEKTYGFTCEVSPIINDFLNKKTKEVKFCLNSKVEELSDYVKSFETASLKEDFYNGSFEELNFEKYEKSLKEEASTDCDSEEFQSLEFNELEFKNNNYHYYFSASNENI